MRSDTPQEPTHLLKNPDDYLLSIGRFLRKYSLDELPQIISIIKGDMLFVGPRPALFNQYDLISQRDKKGISQLKPGITGWAQVNGRDKLSIEEKVHYDLEYMERKSFNFDLYIIWLTLKRVINKDGISH
jgi:O-antigen biosynthesis protein WbqP